jgi:hypothetical protein
MGAVSIGLSLLTAPHALVLSLGQCDLVVTQNALTCIVVHAISPYLHANSSP